MYDNTNLAVFIYLPQLPPWKKKKKEGGEEGEHSETALNLPDRLLDFFLWSQKPFQAGTFAKFNPGVSF